MLTYKIIPLYTEKDFVDLFKSYNSTCNQKWCVHDNICEFSRRMFCKFPDAYSYDYHIYYNMLRNKEDVIDSKIFSLYLRDENIMKNSCFMYGCVLFENNISKKIICVIVDENNNYMHSYTIHKEIEGWPPEIPETYKSQCTYKQVAYASTTKIFSNKHIEFGPNCSICYNGKPVTLNGYYVSESDMFEYDETNKVLNIHIPFNVLYLDNYIDTIQQYDYKQLNIINDSLLLKYCSLPVVIAFNTKIHIDNDVKMIYNESELDKFLLEKHRLKISINQFEKEILNYE